MLIVRVHGIGRPEHAERSGEVKGIFAGLRVAGYDLVTFDEMVGTI